MNSDTALAKPYLTGHYRPVPDEVTAHNLPPPTATSATNRSSRGRARR
ncbi:hypothetical protein [Nocardia brasiliensis]